jgi:hypothetical protein
VPSDAGSTPASRVGIHGTNEFSGAGVVGDSDHSVGVMGRAGDPDGYLGVLGNTAGVIGYTNVADMPGVLGLGDVGVQASGLIGTFAIGAPAVAGIGDGLGAPGQFGAGVYGYSGGSTPPAPPDNTGVYARGDGTAVALRVSGKATFSRSGRTYFAKGAASKAITLAGVTTSSMVIATLQTYRSGFYIAAAVPATGKFTVYLNKAATATTYFAWFVIN